MREQRPSWLVQKAPRPEDLARMVALLQKHGLHTVCEEARCPNQGECFAQRTATFMILGRVCTRDCLFCSVSSGKAEPIDPDEPEQVARAAQELGLRHVVVTSVTRDDLSDGGASHFYATIEAIRSLLPSSIIEVLIPDLKGDWGALRMILQAKPTILGHNLETVSRLYPTVRSQGNYRRSLSLLALAKEEGEVLTKSALMLGLGESRREVEWALRDLREASCDLVAMGQYLQPTPNQIPVQEFIPPDIFEELRIWGAELGFASITAAPFVRSSYHTEEAFAKIRKAIDHPRSSKQDCLPGGRW